MAALRMALLTVRLVTRTKVALFFTFVFPVIFLLVYAGLFAHGNPQAVAYMFGPVVTLNIMGSGFWGLGLQSVIQRERGSLRRYRLAPIGAGTIVVSNLLANYFLELPTIALLVFCAVVFFHMSLTIGWLALFVLVTVGTFAFAGFGLTIASIANTMQEAQVYNNLIWLSLLFLSGTTVPLPLLPHWVQRLATFLPATYLVSAFQGIMVQLQPLRDYWSEMLALLVAGAFGLIVARKLFRWEKEEKIPTRGKLWCLASVVPFLLVGVWMNAHSNPTTSWALSYSLMSRASATDAKDQEGGYLVEGFEGRRASEELSKRWKVKTEFGERWGGHSVAKLAVVSPGAVGTRHALRIYGQLLSGSSATNAYANASCDLGLPPKGMNVRGVEFWVRGDPHTYQVLLSPPRPVPGRQPGLSFVPSSEWQDVRIPLAEAALPEQPAGTRTWRLEIMVAGFQGEFWIELDEMRFY